MSRFLVTLAAAAFVSLGLPDGLLGVAWPSIRATFARDLDALGILLAAATSGYMASSFASGRLIRQVKLGTVLAVSCGLTAAALLGYAGSADWRLLVLLSAVLGLGGGAIDAALNTYAALRHGPRVLNLLHACYGIGATLGPLVMTLVLGRQRPWQQGYAIVGGAQLVLAAAFAATAHAWPRTGAAATHDDHSATIPATLARPATQLAALCFVIYAGIEASLGAWTYTLLTLGRGVPAPTAALIVSLYWSGLTAGRGLAALAADAIHAERLLWLGMAGVAAGVAVLALNVSPAVTLVAVALAGVACGPIFPMLVATTPARLGPAHTANAVGVQIAAAGLGVSVLPGWIGVLADAYGLETIATALVIMTLLLLAVHGVLEAQAPARHRSMTSTPRR